jgi:hypothetical protein
MLLAPSMPIVAGLWCNIKSDEGVGTKTLRPFFHVSSHAVVGRLACLTVVPALVIFNVTPPPE